MMATCEAFEDEAPVLALPELPELPELFAALGTEGMGGAPPGVPPALWASMCKKRLEHMHESNHLTMPQREEHLQKRHFHVPGRGRRVLTLQEDPTGKFGGSCSSGTVLWPAATALIEHLDAEVEKSCLNCRVLELGAGCGAVGMFLSIFKGCEAWLTEAPEQLPLLARNASENSPDGLDLQVAPFKWGDAQALEQLVALGTFDMIVGSDVTYRPECLSDLLSTAQKLLSHRGRFFLSFQDRPGEEAHLEAGLQKSGFRQLKRLTKAAKLEGQEEVQIVIIELCHADAEPEVIRPPQATGNVEDEFFRLTGIRPEPVVVPKREKPRAVEPKPKASFKERVVKDLLDRGMVDYLGDVDEETKSKVAASAGYPLSMLQRPSQQARLDEAMAAAAEDWFSSKGKGPNVAEPVAEDRPQESAEKSAFSKQGLVLKCLDGLDWELQDTEDALSVTVTFTHELWLGLCGVSGTGTAFKEAVSFELAEEELRVLHAGSVVLDLRLPATVDAPNAAASVSSRKMRVAVKAPKISKAT